MSRRSAHQPLAPLSPRIVFAAGGVAYAAGYTVFALPEDHWPLLLIAFLLAGVGIGFAETAESTVVAQALPERLHGNGFGVLGLVQSFGNSAPPSSPGCCGNSCRRRWRSPTPSPGCSPP